MKVKGNSYSTITNQLSRLLHQRGRRTISRPHTKVKQMLQNLQESLGLQVPGVYKIPWACGALYIGQMGRSILVHQMNNKATYM